MTTVVSTSVLSPSELVLLRGDVFADKGGMLDKVALLDGQKDVSAKQLAHALFAVALLANEEAGALHLEARPKKALFGLRTVTSLFAVPVSANVEWPAGSLEANILDAVNRRKGPEVVDVLADVMVEDSSSPRLYLVQQLSAALAARGLREIVTEKKLKIFSVNSFRLPEATAAQAAAQPVEPLKQLLATCERERPQVWKLMTDHINSAVTRRTEQSDNSSWND
jgi:hypothetical protein